MSAANEPMMAASPVRAGWLSPREAAELYVAFERRFKDKGAGADADGHSRLARFAAFPFIVGPELVNLIRVNFLADRSIPWFAEADFLLSPMCRPVGDGLYQVDPGLREMMLIDLFKQEPDPGRKLFRLADFLLAYTEGPQAARYPSDIWAAWRWIALSYLQPEAAVKEMSAYLLKRAATGDGGIASVAIEEQLQVSLVLEMVRTPIENMLPPESYRDLMATAHLVAHYWYHGVDALADTAAERAEPGSLLETVTGVLRVVARSQTAEASPSSAAEKTLDAILMQVLNALANTGALLALDREMLEAILPPPIELEYIQTVIGSIATAANLTPTQLAQIPSSGATRDIWAEALIVARRAGKLSNFFRAIKEYPLASQPLSLILDEYQAWVEQYGEPDSGPELTPEPPWEPALAAVRDALAALYRDPDSASRLVIRAEMSGTHIAFQTKPIENWRAILEEAQRLEKTYDLIALARIDHPDDETLINAERTYLQWMEGHGSETQSRPRSDLAWRLLGVVLQLHLDAQASRRIIAQAGISTDQTSFVGSASSVWRNILGRAEEDDKIPALVHALARNYPADAELAEIDRGLSGMATEAVFSEDANAAILRSFEISADSLASEGKSEADWAIQVNYSELGKLANLLATRARSIEQQFQRIRTCLVNLENGGWKGRGSAAFFHEMNDEVLPAAHRLQAALEATGETATRIADLLRQAEKTASASFQPSG